MSKTLTKVCTGCNVKKDLIFYGKDKKGRYGVSSKCKSCRAVHEKLRRTNDDEYKKRQSEYYKQPHVRKRQNHRLKQDRVNNPERYSLYESRRSKIKKRITGLKSQEKAVKSINNSYCRRLLVHAMIPVTNETIAIKRTQLKLKRIIKTLENETT